MQYTDKNRGEIQYAEYAESPVLFCGMRTGNITPTDIDFFSEHQGKAFTFAELKYENAKIPRGGQELAYTRLVDAIEKSGTEAVFFLCSHHGGKIYAKTAVVSRVYYRGEWYSGDGRTLGELWEAFLKKCQCWETSGVQYGNQHL